MIVDNTWKLASEHLISHWHGESLTHERRRLAWSTVCVALVVACAYYMGNTGSAPTLEKIGARRALTLTAQHLAAEPQPTFRYNAIVAGSTGATVPYQSVSFLKLNSTTTSRADDSSRTSS